MVTIEAANYFRGSGCAPAHHGEIIQGAFVTNQGVMRGLVSLPCPLFHSHVAASLTTQTTTVTITPSWKLKARTAARLTLDALGLENAGASIVVRSDTPVGRGFGSSTGDVVAAIRAVLAAATADMSDARIAELAVLSEVASDGLMFDTPVLFAQRTGIVIERFSSSLPPIHVLGFPTSVDEGGVSTLDLPPAPYSAADVDRFEVLRLLMREGICRQDIKTIGSVASASARINQRHLPVPGFDAIEAAAADTGAVGLQVAHSGDIAAFLYDANKAGLEAHMGHARDRLARLGIARSWQYVLSDNREDPALDAAHISHPCRNFPIY